YALGQPQQAIRDQAEYYDVHDLIEFRESVTPPEVNRYLNRAKATVLWSRREGSNRSIVEAMFADVPCILRRGHNFGYHYPYINSQTGRFASEAALPIVLEDIFRGRSIFSPRQ